MRRKPERGRALPDYLPWDDVYKIVHKARYDYRVKDYIWAAILAYTGMRIGELSALRIENIKPEESKIKIVRGKGAKDRYVIAPKWLIDDILFYCEHENIEKGYIFPNSRHEGQPQSTRGVQLKLGEIAKDALGYHVNCHKFRHSFAVNWLKKGGNLVSLKIQLGHADLSTTAEYLLLSLEDVREDFGKVFGGGT